MVVPHPLPHDQNHLEVVKKTVLQKIYYIDLYIFYTNGMLTDNLKNQ